MGAIGYLIIVSQLFTAVALKYLWNIMNIMQFLIFMETWMIMLP